MASEDTDSSSSPLTRPGFLFGSGFVVLIVVLLIVVLATTGGDTNQRASPPGGASSAPSTPGSTTSRPRPAGPTTVPDSAPDTQWRLYHTVALPHVDGAGPRQAGASTATGYAHTPTGALVAAVQIPIRRMLAPDWQAVLSEQIVPGRGRKAWRQARSQAAETLQVEPGQLGQIAGFQFVTYTPDSAVIQLVSRFPDSTLQVSTHTVRWRDGDWKLVLHQNGAASPTTQTVDSLVGYTRWGGV
ncbi:hypothetical protein [Actinopolyspora halophila]|uniref:hypothetical protein n=1 Tax=Actinopolyspora halophila TaxID=1850 RepID=UPI0003676BFD|nr:hypothetical protein [Actinopolyspora halophila]